MSERNVINSKSLQEEFSETYEELFSRCSIVISSPGSFIWCGECVSLFGGIGVIQNLPLRCYVGIENTSQHISSQTKISYKVYNPIKKNFEEYTGGTIIEGKTVHYLKKYLEQKIQKKYQGFQIHILSEIPLARGWSLNLSGAISSALATLIFLNFNWISDKNISKWKDLPISNLLKDQYFDQVFRFAWKLESICHGDSASGQTVFSPFSNSSLPLVYFTQKRAGRFRDKLQDYFPVNLEGHYDVLDKISYFAFSFEELFEIKTFSQWPIDFALIYSGYENQVDSAFYPVNNISKEHFKKITNEIIPKIDKIYPQTELSKKIYFYNLFKNTKPEESYKFLINSLSFIDFKILSSLGAIFKKEGAEDSLNGLFKSLNQSQNFLHSLEVSSSIRDRICSSFHEEVRKIQTVSDIAVKIAGTGCGGDILVVAPSGILKQTIEKFLVNLGEIHAQEIILDYISWLDGYSENGVKIEQYLKESIRSKFISDETINLRRWKNKLVSQTELSSIEKLENEKKTIDLLIDTIENKIYIRGIKLTSKEVHSSSATIEILSILLKNFGKSISNQRLPESSYSQDRNEMQGKIITPLSKIIKEKTGTKLPLKINGGLTNFHLKLSPSNLDIRILEKIF